MVGFRQVSKINQDRRTLRGDIIRFRQVSKSEQDRLHIVDFPASLLAGIVLIGCRRDPRLYARCEGVVSSPPGPCLVPLRSPIRARSSRAPRSGAGLVSPVSLLHCPGHTQQEIADAVDMARKTVDDRLKSLADLDKCPKSPKIAFISSISRPLFCRRCKKSWREKIGRIWHDMRARFWY